MSFASSIDYSHPLAETPSAFVPAMDEPNSLTSVVARAMLTAVELLDLPAQLRLVLSQPKNEVTLHFPVQMDAGNFKLFTGYRVQHNNVLGPYKGGIRWDPAVSLDQVRGLATLMTIKNALARLPFGGATGGVRVAPSELSGEESMRLARCFTNALGSNIGPDHDIAAPDFGTNAEIMAWMADAYANRNGLQGRPDSLAVVTGKPLSSGGCPGREKATGQGVVYVLEHLREMLQLDLAKSTFSLIGYGNVGSWTGRLLAQRGATLRAVMDHSGAIRRDEGIHAESLAAYVRQHGGVHGFPGANPVRARDVYDCPVDLFIPAALEQMVDVAQARLLKCRVLVEAANAPVTPAAERQLLEQGVTILPDVLCNAGGVTVSYLEWQQNRHAEAWPRVDVDRRLRATMSGAVDRIQQAANRYQCDLRTAAHCAGLEQLAEVYKRRHVSR